MKKTAVSSREKKALKHKIIKTQKQKPDNKESDEMDNSETPGLYGYDLDFNERYTDAYSDKERDSD